MRGPWRGLGVGAERPAAGRLPPLPWMTLAQNPTNREADAPARRSCGAPRPGFFVPFLLNRNEYSRFVHARSARKHESPDGGRAASPHGAARPAAGPKSASRPSPAADRAAPSCGPFRVRDTNAASRHTKIHETPALESPPMPRCLRRRATRGLTRYAAEARCRTGYRGFSCRAGGPFSCPGAGLGPQDGAEGSADGVEPRSTQTAGPPAPRGSAARPTPGFRGPARSAARKCQHKGWRPSGRFRVRPGRNAPERR